jgi:hypothetical protein
MSFLGGCEWGRQQPTLYGVEVTKDAAGHHAPRRY